MMLTQKGEGKLSIWLCVTFVGETERRCLGVFIFVYVKQSCYDPLVN